MSHSLSFFFAVALSFTASAAFAQTQPQRAAMALGVAQSGVVRAIDVVDGAHVEAGQVLVELDCEPLRMENRRSCGELGRGQCGLRAGR